MRRALLALLFLLPALGLAVPAIGLEIPGPSRLFEQLIAKATGGSVVAQGVSGWPNALHFDRLELRDDQGAWLTAYDVTLDWHPYLLVSKRASIERLQAGRIELPRLRVAPAAPTPPTPQSADAGSLPVSVDIKQIAIRRAEIGAAVLGAPAVLAVDGSLDLPALTAPIAKLAIRRLDAAGSYTVDAVVTEQRIDAKLAVSEPERGLIAQLAKLPDIGPLTISASTAGPRSALATAVQLSAGPLRADAGGTVNLDGSALDLQVNASAPAMRPAPDISWQGITLRAKVQGPFTRPDASGALAVAELSAAGAGARQILAELAGNAGQVRLYAVVNGARVPGPAPDLLADAPVTLDAAVRLDDPTRPVTFALAHPLLSAKGVARTAGTAEVTADVAVPQLAPFAAIGGIDLQGSTALRLRATAGDAPSIEADGTLGITGGLAPLPGLVGEGATLGLTAALRGQDLTISRLDLQGRTLRLSLKGGRAGGVLRADVNAGLTDLAVVLPTLSGAIETSARVQGTTDKLSVTGQLAGELGAPGIERGPIKAEIALDGLPGAPSGSVRAQGSLAGAPLELAVTAERAADGAVQATIERAAWRSLAASGSLRLPPGATLPLGRVQLRMDRLDDLRPFVAQALSGAVTATVGFDPAEVRVQAEARGVGVPGSRIGRAEVTARVADPLRARVVTAAATLSGIEASGVAGSARLDVTGPQDALAIRARAGLDLSGTPAQIAGAAVLDLPGKKARVGTLQVQAKGETLRLLAPATFGFGANIGVDRLRIGLRQAVLDVSGELSPRLNATATLRAPADLAAIAVPDLALDGTVSLDAKLTGTPADPGGTVRLQASGIRARAGPGRAVPAANLTATAQLAGRSARINARIAAGSAQLSLNGQAPLGAGPLDLRAIGGFDLALLDPILTAGGRQARGRASLNATIAGTAAAPRVSGTFQLAGGEIQDFTQGLRIRDIAATLRAEGETVRVATFTGRAGPGTISATGSIGALAPGLPIDLAITARNARPITSDQLQLDLDADLTLRGQAMDVMNLGGRLLIRRAEIRIPERLPPTVAALRVIRPGEKAAAPAKAGPTPSIALDLQVDAPQQVFVRGRGVDAEMAGALRIRGSASKPQVAGGFDLRRGQIGLAGTTLTFSRGKVGFDGTGLNGKIDPTLDFVAESTANSVTATLNIGGYASAPKIKLSSVPDLPQDEVIAYLLFRRSIKELGPFQYAEIVASLAQLTGIGGGDSLNPLERVRTGLGLDRLSVGAAATGSGATVEAGRYVANGVYLGAKQGTSGTGTGATLQIDITKGLKLETDVGTGSGGNQVGVTYQFEY